jgi:hypothetical protein
MAVAAVDLGLEDRGDELLIAPVLGAGAIGELGQRPRGRWGFQDAKQVSELAAGAHAIRAS